MRLPQPTDVYFFPNGNTAATDGHQQIPDLQRPWLLTFVAWLEGQGVNVADVTFHLPAGDAKLIKLPGDRDPFSSSPDSYTWRFL